MDDIFELRDTCYLLALDEAIMTPSNEAKPNWEVLVKAALSTEVAIGPEILNGIMSEVDNLRRQLKEALRVISILNDAFSEVKDGEASGKPWAWRVRLSKRSIPKWAECTLLLAGKKQRFVSG